MSHEAVIRALLSKRMDDLAPSMFSLLTERSGSRKQTPMLTATLFCAKVVSKSCNAVHAQLRYILESSRASKLFPKKETQGVTVIALGQDHFPAFFVPDSGCAASQRCDTVDECAALIRGFLVPLPPFSKDKKKAADDLRVMR